VKAGSGSAGGSVSRKPSNNHFPPRLSTTQRWKGRASDIGIWAYWIAANNHFSDTVSRPPVKAASSPAYVQTGGPRLSSRRKTHVYACFAARRDESIAPETLRNDSDLTRRIPEMTCSNGACASSSEGRKEISPAFVEFRARSRAAFCLAETPDFDNGITQRFSKMCSKGHHPPQRGNRSRRRSNPSVANLDTYRVE